MKLEWEEQANQAHKATDQDGNKYVMVKGRSVTVTTPDGFEGKGWQPHEALSDAKANREQPQTDHLTDHLTEARNWLELGKSREIEAVTVATIARLAQAYALISIAESLKVLADNVEAEALYNSIKF